MEPNTGDRRLYKYGRRYVLETFGENEIRETKSVRKKSAPRTELPIELHLGTPSSQTLLPFC